MQWNEHLTDLTHVLAGLFPLTQDSYRLVDEASIPRQFVAFQPRAVDNWHEILAEAAKRNKVRALVQVALQQYPEDPYLAQALDGTLAYRPGPVVGEEIEWHSSDEEHFEKIIGRYNTLLPIEFLSEGIRRSRAVARICLGDGTLGTGFLIANDFLLTNHHVIQSEVDAAAAVIQFNYQQMFDGLDRSPSEYRLQPEQGFATAADDDWTCVKVTDQPCAEWGHIELEAVDPGQVDRVNIIQHPGGGPKQIALYHNVVVYADDSRLQYLTDTLPGSSGSPVFDSHWRLVAIHHSGGHIREPKSKLIVFRNEGIAVNCLLAGLRQHGLSA